MYTLPSPHQDALPTDYGKLLVLSDHGGGKSLVDEGLSKSKEKSQPKRVNWLNPLLIRSYCTVDIMVRTYSSNTLTKQIGDHDKLVSEYISQSRLHVSLQPGQIVNREVMKLAIAKPPGQPRVRCNEESTRGSNSRHCERGNLQHGNLWLAVRLEGLRLRIYNDEGVGPTQPLAGFIATLVLEDTIVRILSFLKRMSQIGTFLSTSSGSQFRARLDMSPEEQKMLDQFIKLGPL
ncbi:hypothetical protein HAX54_000615, partial [Datura stramonium]|nr:hypothetical protein [Datura stramonium]